MRPVVFRYTRGVSPRAPGRGRPRLLERDRARVREVFPDAVRGSGEHLADGSEILQVDTYPATITALAAIKELNAETKALRAENAELRARLERIERALEGGSARAVRASLK